MATILIVDDDIGLQQILRFSLQKYKGEFGVLFASNGDEAVRILEQQSIDLLVTDIKMPGMDGLALLSHVSVQHPSIPCIVLTSYNIPGLEQKLSSSVFRFLKKPVEPPYLAKMIIDGLHESKRDGALSSISLPGLMQLIEAEEKTCFLLIHIEGKRQGAMYFHEGLLYDASCGKLSGKDAAVQLLTLDSPQLEYRKSIPKKTTRRIQKGTQALILEAMQIKDESADIETEEKEKSQNQEILAEGIRFCEGLHYGKALNLLLQVVSKNPDNFEGWLWLSRTIKNMKQLRVALNKAHQLNTESPDITRDIQMFRDAHNMNLDQIDRCPFCYAPIALNETCCHWCGVEQEITEKMLSTIGENVDHAVLRMALNRFQDVLTRELNVPVLFYAALSCLHLKDFEATLEYLEQLNQCSGGEESMYTVQVEKIVAYLASKQITEEVESSPHAGTQTSPDLEVVLKRKVLVVEDSPTTRKVIKMTLQRHDFEIIEAVDGVEALTKINDEQPDLILLDVMLPKLDGYGILSALKQNHATKAIPVIMLTSKDGLKDRIKGKFSSANAYLTKPFKPENLLMKVNQYLQ